MTSIWHQQRVDEMVVAVLQEAEHGDSPPHHFGSPYLTAYQLAIKIDQRHPELRRALNMELGGRGTEAHVSLARYLAHELSRQISEHAARGQRNPVEGAFLSNQDVVELSYRGPDGRKIESSLTGTTRLLSLFRRHS